MFDGHKIVVGGVLVTAWAQNPLLDFALSVSKQSGKILGEDEHAKYKGLHFVVKSSKVDVSGNRAEIRGSLPNFLNEGVPTSEQMTMQGIKNAIDKMQYELQIIPSETLILNAEICINVFCVNGVSEVLNAIKGHFNNSSMSRNDEPNFKGVKFERSQYVLKVYDRGRYIGEPFSNILRIELKLAKSEILHKHEIKYLSDLQDPFKVEPLIKLLIEKLQDVIIIDPLNCDTINEVDELKLQAWSSVNYWKDNFQERKHRTKKVNVRAEFESMMQRYGLDSIKQSLILTLCEVWAKSMEHSEYFLNPNLVPFKKQRSIKDSDTLTDMIKCQSVTKNIYKSLINRRKSILPKVVEIGKIEVEKEQNGTGQNIKKCVVCGCDISKKKPLAKVCSKKCGNIKNGKERTERERQKRSHEENILTLLVSESVTLKKVELTFKNGGVFLEKTQSVTMAKIRRLSKIEVRQIIALSGKTQRKTFILTKRRARSFVAYLRSNIHKKQSHQE